MTTANPHVPIRRIVRLFRPYRWRLLFVAVLVGASSLVSLVNQSTIQIVMSSMPAVIYWVTGHGNHMAISIGTLVAFTTLQQSLFRPAVQLPSGTARPRRPLRREPGGRAGPGAGVVGNRALRSPKRPKR